jgi:hypothetical protein
MFYYVVVISIIYLLKPSYVFNPSPIFSGPVMPKGPFPYNSDERPLTIFIKVSYNILCPATEQKTVLFVLKFCDSSSTVQKTVVSAENAEFSESIATYGILK